MPKADKQIVGVYLMMIGNTLSECEVYTKPFVQKKLTADEIRH